MQTINRRTFVKGVVATSLLVSAPITLSANNKISIRKKTNELNGKVFDLSVEKTSVNITGNPIVAISVNGMISGPTLRWTEGDIVTINVTNNLSEDTSIHWHGIILPPEMDGVPGISFDGIKPGETFTYTFPIVQSGTYWYHSHSGFQEQQGVYGAIVIDPKVKDPYEYDREYVISLSDWSDEKPSSIYRKIKLSASYYNFKQRTVGDFFDEVKEKGFFEAFSERKMWNEMKMTDRDISDVSGYTYTYLMNGENPATIFKVLFKNGEKIRLRFINSAAMTFFDVRIPGLKMTVVAADGNNVQAVSIDEFRIGVAETYDVIVSNPPFYTDDFKTVDESRNKARFEAALPFEALVKNSVKILSTSGVFAIIIPFKEEAELIRLATSCQLFVNQICRVKGTPESVVKRSLLAFSFHEKEIKETQLIIETARHEYTQEYRNLTKDFYLKM